MEDVKSISSRLAIRSDTQPHRRSKKTLVVFLSLKNEIAEAIIDGWSVKSIWQLLNDEKRIECSYVRFVRICNKYGLNKKKLTPEKEDFLKEAFKQHNREKSENKSNFETSIERFEYNPVADIKELI